jgi:predicted PurR-regulated permease PerM
MADTTADSALPLTPRPSTVDRQFSFVVLLILTGTALYVAYIISRPFLTALFMALILTIAFRPVHAWIARRIRNANVAAIITETVVVLFVLVPLILISIKLLAETASLYNSLSQQQWSTALWSGHFTWLSEAVDRAAQHLGIPPEQLKATITARVRTFGTLLLEMVSWVARRLAEQIATAVVTLLILFFFLRDREDYSRGLVGMLPLPPGRVQQLATAFHETALANTYGMLVVGAIEGTLIAIGFWITGLRAPLLWGGIATILSFMPRGGPAFIWIPGVIVLAAQGNWIKALVLLAWGVVLVSAADLVVRDRVIGGRINANKLLILLSMAGGLRVFGAIGIIAGPVVLSLVTVLLSMVREEYGSLREARKPAT